MYISVSLFFQSIMRASKMIGKFLTKWFLRTKCRQNLVLVAHAQVRNSFQQLQVMLHLRNSKIIYVLMHSTALSGNINMSSCSNANYSTILCVVSHRIGVGKPKGKTPPQDLGVVGRIILSRVSD
jgi:hypothetical protein